MGSTGGGRHRRRLGVVAYVRDALERRPWLEALVPVALFLIFSAVIWAGVLLLQTRG